MKRVLAICLSFAMLLCFAGCSTQPVQEDESNEIQLDDLSLCIGDRYYGTFSTQNDGEATLTMSQDGIVEIISFFQNNTNEYYIDFQCLSAGEVTITFDIEEYCYKMNVTVGAEPVVKLTEGELCLDISVDKSDATVYVDDTTVTYTVVTAPNVDRLVFEQLASPSPLLSYNNVIDQTVSVFTLAQLVVDDSTLTDTEVPGDNNSVYTAKKEQQDDKLVWTVQWDLGYTAVSIVRVSALDTAAGQEHSSYLHLNVSYPVFDPSEGLESIALFWFELNIDEPLLFTVDTGKLTERQQYITDNYDKAAIFESEAFMMSGLKSAGRDTLNSDINYLQRELSNDEYYDLMFDSSPLYRMNTMNALSQYSLLSVITGNDPSNTEYYPQLKNQNRLVSNFYFENATYIFYGSIKPETRAVMAYLCDFDIDAEKFPYAYSILQRGSEIIDEIISDDMTDFEKEKAIYDWMIDNYNSGLSSSGGSDEYYQVKTAYGLLNGYHSDCVGWSSTFFTLCNMAGLPCSTVDVYAEAGGAVEYSDDFSVDHRINLVRIEDEYYFVEVFWFYQKASADDGDYRYMNMTTEQAAEHYTWLNEDNFGPVECNYSSFLVDATTGELLNG